MTDQTETQQVEQTEVEQTEVEQTEVEQTEVEQTEAELPQIKNTDLARALNYIDVAVTRGAYKGGEISTVGKTRDKLEAFVEFQKAVQAKEEGDETEIEEVKIDMNDIVMTLQLIDAAVERGAFQAKEATTVGEARDVFGTFVEYHRAQQEEAEAAQEETTQEGE